jgi:hypothetical protein
MDRKVFINVTVTMTLRIDEGISVNEVIGNMEYNFNSKTPNADIEDHNITDWEVEDSK